MNTCERSEALRDYAFDELNGADRAALERHLPTCATCEAELHSLRLTTATLRSIPDREIPQRIAFVSDKVFEPSPVARFFQGFWTSPSRLGFASACLIAGALLVSGLHRPTEIRTVVQTATGTTPAGTQDVSGQIDAAVAKAVAQVRAEDAKLTQNVLAAAEIKHQEEHKALLVAMQESMDVMQKRMGAYTSLASLEINPNGAGQ
ncbi:MAG TPA: hypothetical protein VNH18_24080 [Bryobacteraceae bacterium]|nr:hypothetical protein [Bryobacteraceae bacterium]